MIKKETASHKLLRKLGANGGYLGFYYTASAVEILQNREDSIYQCKWLYAEVAALYHTSPFCVERNIRTVIDSMWLNGNRKLLREILPYPQDKKPKSSQFIDAMAHYLSENTEE